MASIPKFSTADKYVAIIDPDSKCPVKKKKEKSKTRKRKMLEPEICANAPEECEWMTDIEWNRWVTKRCGPPRASYDPDTK